jgi:1-deoxy-D-xylulose-5-phosphate synthase
MCDDIPAQRRVGPVDVLRDPADAQVLLVAVGATAEMALDVADRIGAQGITASVVDPRWVLPIPTELVDLVAGHELVVTIEDSGQYGGIGSQLSQTLRAADIDVPTREVGIPRRFLDHDKAENVHTEIGLTAQDISRRVVEWAARIEGGVASDDANLSTESVVSTDRELPEDATEQ